MVDGDVVGIDTGRMYLICSERPDKAFKMAQDLIFCGHDLLCISRYHPDIIKEMWHDLEFESIWLCERPGEFSIPPTQLSRIADSVVSFIRRRKSPIILFDGIEYLSLFNDFHRLQMFVEELNDLAMESRAILLIPIDPRSFDSSSMARLRRFAEVVY